MKRMYACRIRQDCRSGQGCRAIGYELTRSGTGCVQTGAFKTCCAVSVCRGEYFCALWKDADPDIPILKEAKAEYAKLQ